VEIRGPAEACKKLKHHSPYAILRRLKRVIPFFGETLPRSIATEKGRARDGDGYQ